MLAGGRGFEGGLGEVMEGGLGFVGEGGEEGEGWVGGWKGWLEGEFENRGGGRSLLTELEKEFLKKDSLDMKSSEWGLIWEVLIWG